MRIIKNMVKAYRIFLLVLFVAGMAFATFALCKLYAFLQPVETVTATAGNVKEPGKITVTLTTTAKEPPAMVLIAPDGREYTASSRDVETERKGNATSLSILTAQTGEWKVRYRPVLGAEMNLSRSFEKSDAAILVSTSAVRSKSDRNKYEVSFTASRKNYAYTMRAVRRSDGFSLTSQGDGGTTVVLAPYAYSGVWDFYLNTTRGSESYSTSFSYTF